MVDRDVIEQAKAELRLREWASRRGKNTRAYIREHPEIVQEFEQNGSVADKNYPPYVTQSSLNLELRKRVKDRETRAEARKWMQEHPEEVARIREEVYDRQSTSTTEG